MCDDSDMLQLSLICCDDENLIYLHLTSETDCMYSLPSNITCDFGDGDISRSRS